MDPQALRFFCQCFSCGHDHPGKSRKCFQLLKCMPIKRDSLKFFRQLVTSKPFCFPCCQKCHSIISIDLSKQRYRFQHTASDCPCFVRDCNTMLWFTSGINVSDLQSFCDLYILLEHSADNSAHLCIDRLLPGPGNKLAFFYGISDFCHRLHDSICTGTDQTLGCKAAYISRNSGIWDCFFFPDHISQCMSSFCLDDCVKSRSYTDDKRRVRDPGSQILLCQDCIHYYIWMKRPDNICFWIHQYRNLSSL